MVWSSKRKAVVSGFIAAMLHWCLMDDTSVLSIPQPNWHVLIERECKASHFVLDSSVIQRVSENELANFFFEGLNGR